MPHEVVRLPANMAELSALNAPKLRKVVAQLMDERVQLLTNERAHRIGIAGLVARYGNAVLGADQKVHAVSLVIREKDVRVLPDPFDVDYQKEEGGLRCVITSSKPFDIDAAKPDGKLTLVGW